MGYPDSSHRLLDLEGFKRLLTQQTERANVTLIVAAKEYNRTKTLLPEPVFVAISQDLVFAQFSASTADPKSQPSSQPSPPAPAAN